MYTVLFTIMLVLLAALAALLGFWRKLVKALAEIARDSVPAAKQAAVAESAQTSPIAAKRSEIWAAGDAKGSLERKELLILESLLFASAKPLSIERAAQVVGLEEAATRKLLGTLRNEYRTAGRSFLIDEVAEGFKMVTRGEYGKYVSDYYKIKVKTALSRQALESLAVVAYKQPVTRSDIEGVRGVNVDAVVSGLMERNLIRSRGRRAGAGRPLLFGTSDYFLEYFGLKSLDDLPTLEDIEPLEEIKRGAEFLTEYERRLRKTDFEEKDVELPFERPAEAEAGPQAPKEDGAKRQKKETGKDKPGQVDDPQPKKK
jgi:segregation and condensation protein B